MEVGGTDWQDHEFLHGQFVSSMAATIDDIKGLAKKKSVITKTCTLFIQ